MPQTASPLQIGEPPVAIIAAHGSGRDGFQHSPALFATRTTSLAHQLA